MKSEMRAGMNTASETWFAFGARDQLVEPIVDARGPQENAAAFAPLVRGLDVAERLKLVLVSRSIRLGSWIGRLADKPALEPVELAVLLGLVEPPEVRLRPWRS